MAGETILVVDDDADIREILTLYLQQEGYEVVPAEDGNEAVSLAFRLNPDLIILDMMLPGLDGIEICQEVRKKSDALIIFLSCKGNPLEKSMGLTAGGDDYMSKPFEAVELIARVKALLRRCRLTHKITTANILRFPGLTIDLTSHTVEVSGQLVVLSPKEFQLLALFAQQPNTVLSCDELFQTIWEAASLGDHRTVMVHISNIRKKIEQDPANPKYIHTIKGVGYKFLSEPISSPNLE